MTLSILLKNCQKESKEKFTIVVTALKTDFQQLQLQQQEQLARTVLAGYLKIQRFQEDLRLSVKVVRLKKDCSIYLIERPVAVIEKSMPTASVTVELLSMMPGIEITTTVVISNMVAITLLECSIQLNLTTKMLTVLIITNVKLLISKGIAR